MTRMKTAAALGTAAVLSLAACSNGGTPHEAATTFAPDTEAEITFTWWGNEERAEWFERALDLFNEEYPNVEVVRNFNAWGDYWTARNTEAAGHALPDVLMMDAGYLGEYAEKGLFLDLGAYQGGLLDTEGYSETLIESGTVDGEFVGVPMGYNAWSMMYNKDLLDELGVPYPTDDMTLADLEAYVLQVNQAGAAHDPRIYGASDYTGGFPGFIYHRMQQGERVFTEDGGPAFSEDDVVDYLDSVAGLRDNGDFYPVERSVALDPLGGFLSGETALWFNFSTTVAQAMSDIGTENIGMVQAPTGNGEHVLADHPSMLLSVSAGSDQPDAAAVLVDFLANSPEVKAIFGASLGAPPTEEGRAAVDQSASDAVDFAYLDSIADELTESYPLLPSGYGSIEAKWGSLHEQLLYGDITTEQMAEELFSEMDMLLG
ncbi:ABC transporter substrate-binding protein [Glycomyces arizonensis]|uniref:ABC transporter substrate-binding protein n=1 Tax=Glycomyces arizonensis TaxID=256035 RepID=UPI000407F08A|nr:extracellular solute-binding protein [Glycomyces arizonensis]